ncbi:unnamed protein product [Ixodes persulcatus]
MDELNPEWAPSLKLGYKSSVADKPAAVDRYKRTQARAKAPGRSKVPAASQQTDTAAATSEVVGEIQRSLLPEEQSPEHSELQDQGHCTGSPESPKLQDQESVTELQMKDIARLEEENCRLLSDLCSARASLNKQKFEEDAFRNNDDLVNFYTGLPNSTVLFAIYELLQPHVSHNAHNCLSKFQEMILFFMRLRMNVPLQDLAYRFGVSQSTVSRIVEKWLDVAYTRLSDCVKWPEREHLKKTMPMTFRKEFGSRVAVILDCFEIFIERPSSLVARALTWSTYKHHNTVKYLIGIAPQGVITFISKGWGGRASDKLITESCGVLDNLLPGDSVLADRGFRIADAVGVHCARLEIPAFTRGRAQLPPAVVESTRKLANVRIHVERVIGLVRNKYTILKSTIPVDSLVARGIENATTLAKIVAVCCAFNNLCDSVVPFD